MMYNDNNNDDYGSEEDMNNSNNGNDEDFGSEDGDFNK